MPELISVSSETVDAMFPELPRMVRLALRVGSKLRHGTLDVTLADGRIVRLGGIGPGPAAAMTIYHYGFASRLLRSGDIGIAEAYLRGEWDTPDLTQFLYLFCVNQDWMARMLPGKPLVRFVQVLRHWFNRNTRRQARRNIHAHYDIGNAFYSAWLDPGMTYSSALFEDDTPDLTAAQTNKYRRLAEAIDLRPGQKLLEIGCGWGGFAEMAADQVGCQVVGLTLSQEQAAFAKQRLAKAGLSDRTDIRLQDYRDCDGSFDAIVSIEMFEAIGEKHWPLYFQRLRDRLKPGKCAALQIITIAEERFQEYRANADFIQRYVFPGGMLPTKTILQNLSRQVGLDVVSMRDFGESYARTLATCRDTFHTPWSTLSGMGFDQRFRNLWDYYLCYCQAGFETKCIDVVQLQLRRPA